MPDMVKVSSNERLDLLDFQHAVNTMPAAMMRHLSEQILTNPTLAQRCWIARGFAITNPSGSQIQVTKGAAILSWKEGTQVYYGMLTTEGDTDKTVDIATYVNGTYDVYIRFEFIDANTENRVFWNPAGLGSEFAQIGATRRQANWGVRLESTNPGGEWFKIATVVKAPGISITDKRSFYFEGAVDASYVNTWGAGNDRNANRATYGIGDFQTFTSAMRTKFEDVMGKNGGRWWSDLGYGLTGTWKAGDSLGDFVVTGLTVSIVSGLGGSIDAGTCYAGGTRVVKSGSTSNTFPASRDSYVDLNWLGVFTYPNVPNGNAEPTLTANSIRLAKVVTSGVAITAISNRTNAVRLTGNRQTVFEAGATRPVYLRSATPSLGLNAYYDDEASVWKYGRGSATHYGAAWVFDPSTGALSFQKGSSQGNADNTISSWGTWLYFSHLGRMSIMAGTTPAGTLTLNSANGEDYSALFFGDTNLNGRGIGRIAATDAGGVLFIANAYNSTGDRYYCTSATFAQYFKMDVTDGSFKWVSAIAGTAGNLISWNERMRLTGVGQLSINAGTTIAGSLLLNTSTGENNDFHFGSTIVGGRALGRISCTTGAGLIIGQNSYYNTDVPSGYKFWGTSGYACHMYFEQGTGDISFASSSAASGGAGTTLTWVERMRLTQGGHLGIGVSPLYRLHTVNDAMTGASDIGAYFKFTQTAASSGNTTGIALGYYLSYTASSPTGTANGLTVDLVKTGSYNQTGNISGIRIAYYGQGGAVTTAYGIKIDPPSITGGSLPNWYAGYFGGVVYIDPRSATTATYLQINRNANTYDGGISFYTASVQKAFVGLGQSLLGGVNNDYLWLYALSGYVALHGTILPDADATYDLGGGGPTYSFRDIYFTPTATGTPNAVHRAAVTGKMVTAASDIRLKKDIVTISDKVNVIDILSKLRGVYYNWDISNPLVDSGSTAREIGMLAQEVIDAGLPELTADTHLKMPDGSRVKTLHYSNMVGYLIEVCKELNNKIDALNKRLNN